MNETQKTITEWSRETFGKNIELIDIAVKANEEMAELLASVLTRNSPVGEEIADVIIVLMRLATEAGTNVVDDINNKMKANRQRKWNPKGEKPYQHLELS